MNFCVFLKWRYSERIGLPTRNVSSGRLMPGASLIILMEQGANLLILYRGRFVKKPCLQNKLSQTPNGNQARPLPNSKSPAQFRTHYFWRYAPTDLRLISGNLCILYDTSKKNKFKRYSKKSNNIDKISYSPTGTEFYNPSNFQPFFFRPVAGERVNVRWTSTWIFCIQSIWVYFASISPYYSFYSSIQPYWL